MLKSRIQAKHGDKTQNNNHITRVVSVTRKVGDKYREHSESYDGQTGVTSTGRQIKLNNITGRGVIF